MRLTSAKGVPARVWRLSSGYLITSSLLTTARRNPKTVRTSQTQPQDANRNASNVCERRTGPRLASNVWLSVYFQPTNNRKTQPQNGTPLATATARRNQNASNVCEGRNGQRLASIVWLSDNIQPTYNRKTQPQDGTPLANATARRKNNIKCANLT